MKVARLLLAKDVRVLARSPALVAAVAVALALALAVLFAVAVELAGDAGPASWARLPLLAAALALAGAAFGAFGVLLGVLAREPATASLVAFLVALPFVLVGLVPEAALAAVACVAQAFPFAHGVRLFEAALFQGAPWKTLALEGARLLALTAVFGAAARAGVRRLLL